MGGLLEKIAHRIVHAMQANIIRRIKEECETPSQTHHSKGKGLAYTIAPLGLGSHGGGPAVKEQKTSILCQ